MPASLRCFPTLACKAKPPVVRSGGLRLHQPGIPAPIPIRLPFPPFATAADEAVPAEQDPDDIDPFNLPAHD